MKLFGRTSGYYLFWTGFVYFWIGVYLATNHSEYTHVATVTWLFVLSIPLWCPPVARHFNMEPMMFDWFKSREERKAEYDNVVKFPAPVAVPPMPEVEPPKRDPIAYRIGKTEEGKVTLSLGDYGNVTVTMNNAGVDQLIRMLEAAKNQDEVEDV